MHPGDKYPYDGLSPFLRAVCHHYIQEHKRTATPSTTRSVKRMRTTVTPEVGPAGEDTVVNLVRRCRCEGDDLENIPDTTRDGRHRRKKCKYCWNAHTVRIRKDTRYQCSRCKTPLCVTCNYKYHNWIEFSEK